jgi:Tfp pilus assembly protein PilF
MEHSADFPHGRLNLGIMYANLGQRELAEENYKKAIEIDDQFYPARVNLAMLYNEMGKNSAAETLFREVLENHPEFYDLSYSFGLLLAEEKRLDEAAVYLERAARGMPDRARVTYNYSLVLRHLGRNSDALSEMIRAYQIERRDPEIVQALAIFYIQEKQWEKALLYAQELVKLVPDAEEPEQMLKNIQQVMEAEKKNIE